MYNPEIYKQFIETINTSLHNTLKYIKTKIFKDVAYKYASNIEARIDYLEKSKHDYFSDAVLINPFDIKGVFYSNNKFNLVLGEVNELIEYYNINLVNTEFGLFLNEQDKNKSFGNTSFMSLLVTLNYCLTVQVINELIKKESIKDFNYTTPAGDLVFLNNQNVFSEAFFKYLVEHWLKKESNLSTALKHVTYRLNYRNIDNELEFKISSSLSDFAKYWNDNYSKLLKLDNNRPKLNELNTSKGDYYEKQLKYYYNLFKEGKTPENPR